MDYFRYDNGEGIVPEGAFRISPSQLSRFFDEGNAWWREFLMGESGFSGNTATELGTCVHSAANMYTTEGVVHHDQIINYINSLTTEFDKDYIKEQYPQMVDALINEYLSTNKPHITEKFLWKELLPGIGVGGSLDSIKFAGNSSNLESMYKLRGNTIIDYKTTSSKTTPTRFSRSYYFQQLAYVWLCKQHGIDIEFIKLLFITTADVNRISEKTGKRLQDYPSTTSFLLHQVTDQDMELIDGVLRMVAQSVQLWKTNPELRWALAKDWRLYEPPKPKLFLNTQP